MTTTILKRGETLDNKRGLIGKQLILDRIEEYRSDPSVKMLEVRLKYKLLSCKQWKVTTLKMAKKHTLYNAYEAILDIAEDQNEVVEAVQVVHVSAFTKADKIFVKR